MIAITIVEREGTVLLLRRSPTAPWKPGWYNLPGGVVEPGELPHEAAARELQEEAGLAGVLLTPLTVSDSEWGPLHVFKTEAPPEFVPTLCYESDEFCWASTSNLPANLVDPLFEVLSSKHD